MLNVNGQKISDGLTDFQVTLEGNNTIELPNGSTLEVPDGVDRSLYVEFDP